MALHPRPAEIKEIYLEQADAIINSILSLALYSQLADNMQYSKLVALKDSTTT